MMRNIPSIKVITALLSVVILVLCACERRSPDTAWHTQRRVSEQSHHSKQKRQTVETVAGTSSSVKMKKKNGVYMVPIEINGVEMEFIFDTGASDITISNVEAMFLLRQGKLTESDILGEAYYQIADGSIAVGTIINLKDVQIANKKLHNVQASVVDNIDAPLLLGQSALARFGKISIDYNNSTISFQ